MMGNKVKGILLFLIFAPLILGAKTTVACNSGNSLTKEAMQSVNTEINPDSIKIYGTMNLVCPGERWGIFECNIIFKDTISEIYVQGFGEQSSNKENFLITLNKAVTDRLKTLLYSIYCDSNTALNDGIPNERSVKCSDRCDLSIKLFLNGKIINEFFYVNDIQESYRSIITSTNTLDPFKPPFYKMLELIYNILFQIDKEIYHGRSNRKAADWIENEFNYNYYKPGYRTVTDKIMHLRSSANAIKAIYRTICDTNKKD